MSNPCFSHPKLSNGWHFYINIHANYGYENNTVNLHAKQYIYSIKLSVVLDVYLSAYPSKRLSHCLKKYILNKRCLFEFCINHRTRDLKRKTFFVNDMTWQPWTWHWNKIYLAVLSFITDPNCFNNYPYLYASYRSLDLHGNFVYSPENSNVLKFS